MQYSFDENGSDLLCTRAGVDGPGPFHTFTAPLLDANGRTVANLPCQKSPWGQLHAIDVKTGNLAREVPLGITEQHRFRAINSKTGKELWSVKLDASDNANPMTYLGKNGKQYVAIVSGAAIHSFALP